MTDEELKRLLQAAGFHNAENPYAACGTIQNFRKLVELLKEANDRCELHKDAYESFGMAAATMKDFGIAAGAAASGVDTFAMRLLADDDARKLEINKAWRVEVSAFALMCLEMYPKHELDVQSFDECSRFMSRPVEAHELRGVLAKPKNKPFYRQFEEGKKWKF